MSDTTTIPDKPIPGGVPQTDLSLPAPVNETPADFNPFADDKGEQTLTSAPTPLMERMRLHFKEAQTKETPFGAAAHFGETAIERGARARGNPSDLENEVIDRAVKTRDDLASYDRMPGANGFLEYGAAILGHVAGNVADPTSAIGNVFKIPYLATKGVIGRMTEFGINQAFVNTATDPWIQSLNIATKDGTRDKYDLFQTFVESPISGFVGGAVLKGAHEAGSALFIRPQAEKDALTFFRMLRDAGGAEEQKRWPEIFNEVQGKSDVELADMAKQIGADDKAAGDKAAPKEPSKAPSEPLTPDVTDPAAEIRAAAEHEERFFQSRGLTHEKVTALPEAEQAALHEEYKAWSKENPMAEVAAPEATTAPTAPEAKPVAPVRPPNLPADVPDEVFHGSGRTDKSAPYNQGGGGNSEPILGKGTYFSFDHATAGEFGPHVETGHVGDVASNPLIITDGAQWRALTAEAGWSVPNPFGREPKQLAADIAKLRKLIEAKGHDGAVIWWDAKSPYDIGPNGENIKLLRDVFGDPQAVSFKGRPKGHEPAGAAHVDENHAIGDTLAAQAAETDPALGVAMRTVLEASLPRAPEATHRATLTSNLVDAPNLRTLWTDLARELGATVRAGRMTVKNALGLYFTRTGVIRMRQLDDLTVLAHELGHHVEIEYGKPLQDIIHGTGTTPRSVFGGRELDNMTYYAQSHPHPVIRRKEGFAEFFRLLIEHPAEADRRAPNFNKDFQKFLEGEPALKATIEKAQRGFDDYRAAYAPDVLRANIATSAEPRGWAKLRKDVRNDGFWNTITDRSSRIYTGVVDENNSLAVAVQALLKTQKDNTGKIISLIAADDPAKLIRLAQNAHQAGMIDMMHGVVPYRSIDPEGPSLHDAIALATGKPNIMGKWDEAAVQQFSSYLIARRGVFEWERRAAGLHDKDPMPFPKDMYETEIKASEKENPNIRQAAEMVHEWTRNLLKKELEAGLITHEAYDNALKVRDYTPLMRDLSDKNKQGGDAAFDATTVGLKGFKGSSRPIIDPLQSLMERSFRTADLIAHNDAIKALDALAVKAGVGGGKIAERIPAQEIKARFVDPLEGLRKGLADQGVSKVDADLAISNMLNDLRIDEKDLGPAAIFRSAQAATRGENIIFHLVGGELKALRLKEGEFGKELITSLTGGLSKPLQDWNLQGMAKVSAILRAGVTTSPDFFITNTLRDQMATWILNRGTFPLVDSFRGIWRELTGSELSRAHAQMGGIAGGANLNALDHARIDKDIDSLASKGITVARFASFEGIFKMIELSETGTRVGLFEVQYKRALKQGLTPYQAAVEAAFSAKDNLDFGRHGSRMGTTIKLIPFLNAQLQGLDKAWRTLVTPAFKEALTKQDVEAQKTMLSAYAKITALTGLSMALRANYIDDPEYAELSPYMRNTHWMVRIPGAKGNKIVDALGRTVEVPPGLRSLWLAIPKPFELAIIPNLGERAVEALMNKDPQALWRWATGATDLVSAKTMMSSVAIKAAAEMQSGKDFFTGRDIVPEHLQGLDAWAQASAGTSAFSKYIGDASNRVHKATGLGPDGGLSPMFIDQLIKGVGGSQARSLLSMLDMAVGTKGDQSLADTPIAQRVFKEAYRGSTSTTEFWDQVADKNGKLAKAANTYDKLLSNPAAAANYVAGLSDDKRVFTIMTKSEFSGDEKSLHPLVNAHKAMTAISTLKREIANRTVTESATGDEIKLSSSEQRVAMDALSRIQMWTARNALIDAGTLALTDQKRGAIDADMEALEKTVPSVHTELSQRYANAKVYKADSIAAHWDEVKRSVIDDGSDAKLSGIAHEVQRDGFELDFHRDKKKKARPKIPGALE